MKMTQYNSLAANIPSKLKLFCKIHEYKRVDLVQGGGVFSQYYILNTATQAYFLFVSYY